MVYSSVKSKKIIHLLYWKSLLSVVFTILLLIVLFHFYPVEDFIEKFVHFKLVQVLIILGTGLFFLLSTGIELFFYYRIYAGRNISLYDVVTLPIVMNLWGHVLPFQGSFIYNAVYLKSKY